MRLFLVLCWMTIPLLAWAYHVGPGQQNLALDDASYRVQQAKRFESEQDFGSAVNAYGEALSLLQEANQSDQATHQHFEVRLAMAKAQMQNKQLPEARYALQSMLDEMEDRKDLDSDLVSDTRQSLASAQYFMTWLMRLEGLPETEWEPEIEASRQNFRLLTEQAEADNGSEFESRRHDLEAAIQLARMDLADLQSLKIPSQCNGCCSGQCNKPNRKQAKKKSENKKAGAGLGPLPDGSGA
ncbi:MAG: hypothetical protein AAF745_08595 [Planctomycetota bacterium]